MLPLLASMYPEVHERQLANLAREAALEQELAEARGQSAKGRRETAATAHYLLERLGDDDLGHDARHEVAAYLEAHHDAAAAASFLEGVRDEPW